jgi:hypothetical protein
MPSQGDALATKLGVKVFKNLYPSLLPQQDSGQER